MEIKYPRVTHSKNIVDDETWRGETWLHRITGELTVEPYRNLTLEPGCIVKFDFDGALRTDTGAGIVAIGTGSSPIVFTSASDGSVGYDLDGGTQEASPGGWQGITTNGAVQFKHVHLRYGGEPFEEPSPNTAMLVIFGEDLVEFENCRFSHSEYSGLTFRDSRDFPVEVQNCVFHNCGDTALYNDLSNVNVSHCTFDRNSISITCWEGRGAIVNTAITNSETGILNLPPNAPLTFSVSDCNLYNPEGSNYLRMPDQTGMNHNISVEPGYLDAEVGHYQLSSRSVMGDAGNGLVGTEEDIAGTLRNDNPLVPDTGSNPAANGTFPDIGAYESGDTVDSDADLIVTSVSGPSAVTAGETALISWTIKNVGTGPATGPWHDSIYLTRTPNLAAGSAIPAQSFLVGQGVVLAPGESLSVSHEVVAPGGTRGRYFWLAQTNSRGEIAEPGRRENNTGASSEGTELTIPVLEIGGPEVAGTFGPKNPARWFVFEPERIDGFLIELDSLTNREIGAELYLGYGQMPTRVNFDARSSQWLEPDVSAIASPSNAVPIYVLAYGVSTTLPFDINFRISVNSRARSIESLEPATAGNAGLVTVHTTGWGFTEGQIYELVGPGGVVAAAEPVFLKSETDAFICFDLTSAAPGAYQLRVTEDDTPVTSPESMEVVPGFPGEFRISMWGNRFIRVGRRGRLVVEYENVGGADLPAPMLLVTGDADSGGNRAKVFRENENEAVDHLPLLAIGGMARRGCCDRARRYRAPSSPSRRDCSGRRNSASRYWRTNRSPPNGNPKQTLFSLSAPPTRPGNASIPASARRWDLPWVRPAASFVKRPPA